MESWEKVPLCLLSSTLGVTTPPTYSVITKGDKGGLQQNTEGRKEEQISEGLMFPSRHLCSTPHHQVGPQERKCVPRVDLVTESEWGRTGLGENLREVLLVSCSPGEIKGATCPHLSQERTKCNVRSGERALGPTQPHSRDKQERVCHYQYNSSKSFCV